jgi:hypothetical protein
VKLAILQACHNWQHLYRTGKIILTYTWLAIFNLATFLHFKTTLYHSVHLNFCPFIFSLCGVYLYNTRETNIMSLWSHLVRSCSWVASQLLITWTYM